MTAEAAVARTRFTASMVAARQPASDGSWVEDVPGSGACLFHSIAQSQDAMVARRLRLLVIDWVRDKWDANPNIAGMLGPMLQAVLHKVHLQEWLLGTDYGGTVVHSLAEYCALVSSDAMYGTEAEAAIAASILGVCLSIYSPSSSPSAAAYVAAAAATAASSSSTVVWQCESAGLGEVDGEPRMIALVHRDKGLAAHYQILHPPTRARPCAAHQQQPR